MFLFKLGQRVRSLDVAVFLADHQRRRLAHTCFRANAGPKAGNFAHWKNIDDVFHDPRVKSLFGEQVARIIEAQQAVIIDASHKHHESFTIDVGRAIGWSAAAPAEAYDPSQPAPKTSQVTFLCQFRFEHTKRYGNEWKAIILHLTAGAYASDIRGNINDRSRLVLFPWSHPGEPLHG